MPSIWKQDANGAEKRLGKVSAGAVGTTLAALAANEVAKGRVVSPSARALRATRPAAIRTEGFEVLVQLVIAAITTSPWVSECSLPLT